VLQFTAVVRWCILSVGNNVKCITVLSLLDDIENKDGAKLSCKERSLKKMLSSYHCCVSFHVKQFSLVSHNHLRFTSSSLPFNCCAIWCYYYCYCFCFCVLISIFCCYSLYIYIKTLPILCPIMQVNAYMTLYNELAMCGVYSINELRVDHEGAGLVSHKASHAL
jgi:hypothetical protein